MVKKKTQEDLDAQYDAFNLAFGEAIREWAQFEIIFGWLLTLLLQADEFRTRIIWGSLPNFAARHRLIVRLGESYLDDTNLPAFRALMRRAKGLARQRNKIAHSHGGVDTDGSYLFLSEGDDEGVGYDFMKSENLQFQNVKNLAAAINKLAGDIIAFRKTVVLHVHSKMHRERRSHLHPSND